MRFLIFGRSLGLKKKTKKKNYKKSRNRRPWHPNMTLKVNIYIFIFVFAPVFLYAATMLIFQIKRINHCKWKMVQLRLYFFFFFFFLNAKNLGRSDDAKRRKKEDDLTLSDAFWWWEMNWFKFPRFQDDSVDGRPRSLAQLKISAQNTLEFQHDHPDRVRSFHFWSWRTKNLS